MTHIAEEAERAVLGSMMVEKGAAARARLELDAMDFAVGENRIMFDAMCEIIEEQGVVDTVTVIERLRLKERLADVGGPAAVLRTIETVATAAHLPYYCRIVKQASLERQFTAQLSIVHKEQNAANVAKLDDILARISGEGVGRIVDFQTDLTELVEELLEKPVIGFHTGFFQLDNLLNRVEPGDLVTIGARTSGGKTAFMVQTAVQMASNGVPVGLLTTEMDEVQLIKRMLPAASRIPAWRFRAGSLTAGEKDQVRKAVYENLSKLPIKVYAKPRMSLKDIRGFLVKSACDVAFFDYLQRAKMPKAESRVYEIEEFMVGLKTLARSTKKVIVTAVQLDRGLDKNPTVPPELADLRGSGAIEAESDTVILLWRPPKIVQDKTVGWVPPTEGCVAIEALIKKNRHGPAPTAADFELDGELVKIAERTLNKRAPDQPEGEAWYE